MLTLWAVRQSASVAQAKSAATNPNYKARELAQYCEYLEGRIDKLNLICRAMWAFLQETAELTEEDLAEKVREVDLMDGKLDGKVGKGAVECPECGKMIAARHKQCIWCGAEPAADSEFDRA